MPSTHSRTAPDTKLTRTRRKPVLRVARGASVVSTTGNRKRFGESFKRWQRTKAAAASESAGVMEEMRRSRDAGYF